MECGQRFGGADMRIGELAKQTGLSRDTIRFYERKGLLDSDPSREPSNDYRNYPQGAIERLVMIRDARRAGFTVADLQSLFRHLDRAARSPFDAERFLDLKIQKLREGILRSRRLLKMLRQTKSALKQRGALSELIGIQR